MFIVPDLSMVWRSAVATITLQGMLAELSEAFGLNRMVLGSILDDFSWGIRMADPDVDYSRLFQEAEAEAARQREQADALIVASGRNMAEALREMLGAGR